MAFKKTSVGLTAPTPVDPLPHIGDEKDGKVWDGEKWVSKVEWEAAQAKGSKLPGDHR
jgi:hypothetical protein